jgi:hypothetical protein
MSDDDVKLLDHMGTPLSRVDRYLYACTATWAPQTVTITALEVQPTLPALYVPTPARRPRHPPSTRRPAQGWTRGYNWVWYGGRER